MYEHDREHALDERLSKDYSREGGYRTAKEPVMLRPGGTLRLNFEYQQNLEADNAALKLEVAELKKKLAAKTKKGGAR